MADDPYATVDDLANWLGYPAPEGAEEALKRAERLIVNLPQVKPVDDQPDDVLRDAVCAQVELWIEIGRGKIELSHDILRLGGQTTVGAMTVPEYPVVAPLAIQEFQNRGNWNPAVRTTGFRRPWYYGRR